MRLWVDADAVPRDVREVVLRAARRIETMAIFVANRRIDLPAGNPFASAVRVEGGPDVADRHIAENAAAGDIAITADIPLASILVGRGVVTIDPRGELYSADNIAERLSVRDFMEGLRGAGVETGGARQFGPKDKQNFANALDRAIARAGDGR